MGFYLNRESLTGMRYFGANAWRHLYTTPDSAVFQKLMAFFHFPATPIPTTIYLSIKRAAGDDTAFRIYFYTATSLSPEKRSYTVFEDDDLFLFPGDQVEVLAHNRGYCVELQATNIQYGTVTGELETTPGRRGEPEV